MAAAVGWYGPLIDLSAAGGHVGDFVQLVVLVRRTLPSQDQNAVNGRTLPKAVIEVGDNTRSNFSISIWSKHMNSVIVAGDVILLQNVKIVQFRNALEATTVQISAIQVLLHSKDLNTSKGTDKLVLHCKLGETARAKLNRVAEWILRTESTCQDNRHQVILRNWKDDKEKKSTKCVSISEILCLHNSFSVHSYAVVAEMLLPCSPTSHHKGQLSISKGLSVKINNNIAEEFITTGCKLCGSPLDSKHAPGESTFPLYCPQNAKYLHDFCLIYRPFLIYVRDQSGQVPLLVKNKAAEILFANITAENVFRCYTDAREHRPFVPETLNSGESAGEKPDLHVIWLILIKCLLRKDKNSPFRFEIAVDSEKDLESGRFELVSLTMPISPTAVP